MQARSSISVDSALLNRLRKLAAEEGVTISGLIERLCLQGIGDAELIARARRDPLTERLIEEMLRPENVARAAKIVGQESENPDLFRRRAAALSKAMEFGRGKAAKR